MENDNHPLTNGTYDGDLDLRPQDDNQTTVEPREPNEYLSEHIEAFHQLCNSGESDCPWATWEESFSYDMEAILGVRLETLCRNRRRINEIFE